jgi:hypothetical protein
MRTQRYPRACWEIPLELEEILENSEIPAALLGEPEGDSKISAACWKIHLNPLELNERLLGSRGFLGDTMELA